MGELILIMVVALIVLGPKQLLETAKVAGKVYRELVKMAGEIRNSVDLDALTSNHGPHVPPPPPAAARPSPPDTEKDLAPRPGEKSGPDFYADLLESAREQVRESEAEKAKQPETPGDVEHRAKEHGPEEKAKTT
jgi:Sec-independent protein translocase protein TatA